MHMLLLSFLTEINEKINQYKEGGLSKKELYLYAFLAKDNSILPPSSDSHYMEKICYSAYFKFDEPLESFIKKEQRTGAIGGMHYSNNLVELIAMGKHDFDNEKIHLIEYSKNCNIRDYFIINYVFPNLELPQNSTKTRPIDELVEKVLVQKEMDESLSKLADCFNSDNDILDLFLIKRSFVTILESNPSTILKKDLKSLILDFDKITAYYRKNFTTFYSIVIVFIAIGLLTIIGFFIDQKWDSLRLEPKAIIIGLIGTTFGIVYKLIIDKKVNLRARFLKFIEWRIEQKFFVWGILKSKLDKIKSRNK